MRASTRFNLIWFQKYLLFSYTYIWLSGLSVVLLDCETTNWFSTWKWKMFKADWSRLCKIPLFVSPLLSSHHNGKLTDPWQPSPDQTGRAWSLWEYGLRTWLTWLLFSSTNEWQLWPALSLQETSQLLCYLRFSVTKLSIKVKIK